MQEKKDPAIKLFGQKIPFPGEADAAPPIVDDETVSPAAMDVDKEELEDFGESETEDEKDKDPRGEKVSEKTKEADTPPKAEDSIQNTDEESATSKTDKSEKDENNDNSEENNNNSKTLKKPDKILPCPRCKSMDTKFCYYNNYNVNQPRYFCKACQRYWTAGGTMRNVPVGAGRRKNKNIASHFRHITISEALQANGTHLLKPDGRVLSFGLDPPICDSMASVLNLREENNTRNKDNNGDDCSSASSITVSNEGSVKSTPQESMVLPTNNGFIHNVPCISTLPWPYPMFPPGFPMSFYPAPFWNIPWFPSQHSPHSAPPPSSGLNSPTIGKHSRDDNDDNLHEEPPSRQRNGSVLVPKTLRIDDPSEAAKSSIWATLGIKNERVSISGGGMFKGFQSKKDHHHLVEASSVLRANPAALSRSLNFHENS